MTRRRLPLVFAERDRAADFGQNASFDDGLQTSQQRVADHR
jgi:hypothetical protein